MSLDKLKEILEMLRYYNTVEITHTFSNGGQPLLSVCCLKNTTIIQVTMIENQLVQSYDCVEEAAAIIDEWIN